MNGVRWILRCAVFGWAVILSTYAHTQESTFADSAADESPFADPAPIAEGAAIEKSLLAADRAAEDIAEHWDFCRCVSEGNSAAVARIEQVLRSPLKSTGLDYTEQPLAEVVNLLQEDYGIPIQLDVKALDEIGVGPDEPVTVTLHNTSLRAALRLMLKQLQLTYVIRNEVLIITSPEEAESQLIVCVYDIRNLIDDRNDKTIDSVIDTIASCVATETWAINGGGEAEIRPLKPGLLVISQTQAVHEEVRALLETIREMRHSQPVAPDAEASLPTPDAEQVVTRSYVLQVSYSGDAEKIGTHIRDLITQSIPDEQWAGRLEAGQPVVLSILPDRIVLRHTPAVHDQVQALLMDSGVAAPAPANSAPTFGSGFGGGGFGGGGGGTGGGEGGGGGLFQPDPADGQ